MEYIKDVILLLLLSGTLSIIAFLFQYNKQRILNIIRGLVQDAENAIQGTGMGAEKKQKVIAQLESIGITVTAWVDAAIDQVVDVLNQKSGWLLSKKEEVSSNAEQTGTKDQTAP